MKIQCLIVDDEPIARQIVEGYCAHFPELKVVASCGDALEARHYLEKNEIDLMFLDINMPVLDGMAFMKTLRYAPQVVFTTAYKEYAHEAFEVAACDYLLKPFSLERFMVALDKVKEKLIEHRPHRQNEQLADFTYIKSDGNIHKIVFDELCYAEARGNHVQISTDKQTFLTTMTFANFVDLLPRTRFYQVHRSFVINKDKIDQISGNRVIMCGNEIPIGAKYKEAFFKEIGVK